MQSEIHERPGAAESSPIMYDHDYESLAMTVTMIQTVFSGFYVLNLTVNIRVHKVH